MRNDKEAKTLIELGGKKGENLQPQFLHFCSPVYALHSLAHSDNEK
jgi:hypothetical protein